MITQKKTKIVCTIGPASSAEDKMKALVEAGMNVVRINFSHGDFEEHQPKVDRARKISKNLGVPIALMQDLGGPKIRIGDFKDGQILLNEGETFTLTTDEVVGTDKIVHINYPNLPKEVVVGGKILLHDGKKKLEIMEINGNEVVCKVLVGGEIKSKRGVNLPGAKLSVSSITDKDEADLEFGLKNELDFIALSFVRKAEDIRQLRQILDSRKSKAGIIAKIETEEAIENIDEIIDETDAVMVARGDLAIEIGAENVPTVQKMIIKKCNVAGKPVITATQMLESMIDESVPTRAEVSDVANAILDGTDAIMLSEETALGKYPVEAVKVMSRVALRVESDHLHKQLLNGDMPGGFHGIGDSVTASAVRTADRVGADYIVCLTNSGYSARMISRYKPEQPILALSHEVDACKKLVLSFGVYPVQIKKYRDISPVLKTIRAFFLKNKLAQKGDRVVIVGGMPFGTGIQTNLLLVEEI